MAAYNCQQTVILQGGARQIENTMPMMLDETHIHNMMINKHNLMCEVSSSENCFVSSQEDRCFNVSIEELVYQASALMEELSSSSSVASCESSFFLSPLLKTAIAECYSRAIAKFISKVLESKLQETAAANSQIPTLQSFESGFSSQSASEDDGISVKTEDLPHEAQECLSNPSDADAVSDATMEQVKDDADENECRNNVNTHNLTLSLEPGDSLYKHSKRITKDVPPHILYTLRGVRCATCLGIFKSPNAVEELIEHTKKRHPKLATRTYIKLLRSKNSFDKLIGDGIPYCSCEFCKQFGLARFDRVPRQSSRRRKHLC